MGVTYTRAVTVAPGDPITSTQLAKLAAAFNDRLRFGLADCPWRLRFYWLSLFRQVRGPDASGFLWPSQAEFFERFQNLEATQGHWPTEPFANPEGANLASQMMGFVFGNAWIDAEDIRLADQASGGIPLSLGVHIPVNDGELWELAKAQRGGYDPDTSAIGSPAISAAQSYAALHYSNYSPHANSWGDFIAGPSILGAVCEDPDDSDTNAAPINYDIFFTRLQPGLACPPDTTEAGESCHYAGTCMIGPQTTEDYGKHVAGITETPWSYFVFLNDGGIHELPRSQWILGPFSGNAVLRKTANNGVARMLNAFASEFRGTTEQRVNEPWNAQAFDFQRFLTSQYHLAPALGVLSGEFVDVKYPGAQFTGELILPAGTTSQPHYYRPGFLCTGAVAVANDLEAPCTVDILDGVAVLASLTLTPDAEGKASKLFLLEKPLVPNPLKFRLRTEARFTSTQGAIACEATELADYKPQMQDLYAVLRLCGVSFQKEVDGAGVDEESAKLIGENYWKLGCLINLNGHVAMPGSPDAVNVNAVFDAARRFSKMIRILPRENFIGYEVNAAGKSVCYFNRRGFDGIDLFEGIAPRLDPVLSGEIEPGVEYEVRLAPVEYNGVTYAIGEKFTGVAGVTTYTTEGGAVWEVDGIIHTARPKGFTNEWLMGCEFKTYRPNEESLWKPSAYSDFFALNNRCLFTSPEVGEDATLLWHVAFGQKAGSLGNIIAEAPTGYNYATLPEGAFAGSLNVNSIPCPGEDGEACEEYRLNFYRSCRLYEREPEIESATVEINGGSEVVRLVFSTRFHHCPSAPSIISRDFSTWNSATLSTEEFRSVENALRQYLLNQFWGGNCSPGGIPPMGGVPTGQPGNAAIQSIVQSIPDNPFGTCYPHFGFTQLIPSPYIDDNDTQDTHDTPLYHDTMRHCETVLRAICEGYVDGETTLANMCDYGTTNLFAYTFENLLYQASGGTLAWLPNMPTTATSETGTADTRPDRPEGFGPLPNTRPVAELFNLYANAVNLLTDVRVMLPLQFQCQQLRDFLSTVYPTVLNADGENVPPNFASASGGSSYALWITTNAPLPDVTTVDTDWADCDVENMSATAGYDSIVYDQPSQTFTITTSASRLDYRWATVDPDAIHAIPEEWRDMLDFNGVLIARTERQIRTITHTQVGHSEGNSCTAFNIPDAVWDNTDGALLFEEIETDELGCEIVDRAGSISAPPVPTSDWYVADGTNRGPCYLGPTTLFAVTPVNITDAMIRVPLVPPVP